MTSHTLDAFADLDKQLAEMETRLVKEFGVTRRTAVHRLVEQERHRFEHACVHAFVPILVERSVRSQLS